MHATCSSPYGSIIISGGRNEKGTVLDDVWELHSTVFSPQTASSTSPSSSGIQATCGTILKWRKRFDLTLDVPRCAHGAAVMCGFSPDYNIPHLCIIGGFTGITGINSMPDGLRFISIGNNNISENIEERVANWSAEKGMKTVGPRFGVSVCNATTWVMSWLPSPTSQYSPTSIDDGHLRESLDIRSSEISPGDAGVIEEDDIAAIAAFQGMLLFGGVNVERDYSDVWLICPLK